MTKLETEVEAFAEVLATLGDPFASKRAILAARGLTVDAFVALHRAWSKRISDDARSGGGLVARFQKAYSATLAHARQPEPAAARPAEIAMARPVANEVPLDAQDDDSGTAELRVIPTAASLPFKPAADSPQADADTEDLYDGDATLPLTGPGVRRTALAPKEGDETIAGPVGPVGAVTPFMPVPFKKP